MIEFCDILYNYIHNELEPIHLKDKNAEIEIRRTTFEDEVASDFGDIIVGLSIFECGIVI